MAEHNDLGKWGEQYAAEYLQKQGYLILNRDWRYGRSLNDIDIITVIGTKDSGNIQLNHIVDAFSPLRI